MRADAGDRAVTGHKSDYQFVGGEVPCLVSGTSRYGQTLHDKLSIREYTVIHLLKLKVLQS